MANQEKLTKYGPTILSLLLLLGIGAAYLFSGTFRQQVQEGWNLIIHDKRSAVSEFFQSFGFWGPFFILLFMFLQMITVVLPSWLLMVVAIMGYGPVWGSLLSVLGVAMAAAIAFWIGHGLGESVLENMIGGKTEKKMDKFIADYGIGAIALFRLSPFLSNDAISFVSGMVDMNFWRFMLGTLIGIVPLTIALAFFINNTDTLKTALIWISAGGILVYGVYIYLDRRSNKKREKNPEQQDAKAE